PDAIHRVREALLQQLAVELADEFSALYHVHQTPTYQVIHQDISKRALKNICLSYLAWGEAHMANQLVAQQYQTADNMTDRIAALSAAVYRALPCADQLLAD